MSASTTDSTESIQWDCHGCTNQQWETRTVGDGYVQLVSRHSGRCLDAINSSTAHGTRLQQFDCRGAASQQWRR